MVIAFASKDNIYVNEHFGWCQKFFFYEIKNDEFKFIKEVNSSQKIDEEVDKLNYKIDSIQGADILYVSQIGPKAATMVKQAKIFPMKSNSENKTIKEVLESLIKIKSTNPPLWMRRFV